MASSAIPAFGAGFNFTTAYAAVSTSTPDIPGTQLGVGTRVAGTDGSEWIFVKAGGTITQGDVVIVTTNSTWIVQSMTNTLASSKLGQLCGVAGASCTVNQFIWMQTSGYTASVSAVTGMTAFTAARSTATAGRLDDTITGGTTVAIAGIVLLATAASNVAAAVLNNPTVGAND
jgi:hypothetical protein